MHAPLETAPPIAAYLGIRTARRPAWSPDGEMLAFLSDLGGYAQIWTLPVAGPAGGGEPRQLTRTDEPVGSFAFSPKGRTILFTMDCGGDERHQLWLVDADTGEATPLTEDPIVLHAWGAWSPDGRSIAYASNARDRYHMDVYVMEVESRSAPRSGRCVLEGEGWREPVAFFPDGKALVIRDSTWSMSDQTLLRLDLGTGEATPLLRHEGRARYPAVRLRKDGAGLYFVGDPGREFLGLGAVDLATGANRWLAAPEDADITAMALSPEQDRVAYVVNEEGWKRVLLRDLASGETVAVEGVPRGTVDTVAWSPDGRQVAFALDGAAAPAEIWCYDSGSRTAARVTEVAQVPAALPPLVEPAIVRTRSFDGLEVPSFVYRPASPPPAAGYPVVIAVHGGPESQWVPLFREDIQWMVARGIMVVAPNVRGSTGYGRRYMHLDDREKRMDSVADLKAVREWVATEADVDESRIAVFGRSYGGFMVLSAMTEYPELWKMGVEFFGIASFVTLLTTTGPWRRRLRAAEYGEVETLRADLERFSPINRIDRLSAPIFMAQGLDDPRVPPGESEMIYSCLRGLGRTVEYIRVPHEGHGFARAENRERVFGAMAAFLERHL